MAGFASLVSYTPVNYIDQNLLMPVIVSRRILRLLLLETYLPQMKRGRFLLSGCSSAKDRLPC